MYDVKSLEEVGLFADSGFNLTLALSRLWSDGTSAGENQQKTHLNVEILKK